MVRYHLKMHVVVEGFGDVGKVVETAERLGMLTRVVVEGPLPPETQLVNNLLEATTEAPSVGSSWDDEKEGEEEEDAVAPIPPGMPKSSMTSHERLQEVAHYVGRHGAEAASAHFNVRLDTVNAYVNEWNRLLRKAGQAA